MFEYSPGGLRERDKVSFGCVLITVSSVRYNSSHQNINNCHVLTESIPGQPPTTPGPL